MNDNIGDMPIEIFGDYVSDILGEEWSWEYFHPAVNGLFYGFNNGSSISSMNTIQTQWGDGFSYYIKEICIYGNGRQYLHNYNN